MRFKFSSTPLNLNFVKSQRFETLAIAVIVANAIILALETMTPLMLLVVLDKLCLAFFVAELGLRFAWVWQSQANQRLGQALRMFFTDGWHVFDTIAILAAFMPGLGALRTLRLLRLVAKLPAFKNTIEDLLHACQKSWQIFSLALFLTFIGALTGTLAFQNSMPADFGNLQQAFITCYSMMFGDNVSGILSAMSAENLILTMLFAFFVMLMHGLILALVVSLVIDMVQQRRAQTGPEQQP